MHWNDTESTELIGSGTTRDVYKFSEQMAKKGYPPGLQFDDRAFLVMRHQAIGGLGIRARIWACTGVVEVLIANLPMLNQLARVLLIGPYDDVRVEAEQLGGIGDDTLFVQFSPRIESCGG